MFEVDPGRMIRERNIGAQGQAGRHRHLRAHDLPGGGTHIEFEFALQKVPAMERPLVPFMRKVLRKGNEKAMERLAAHWRTARAFKAA